MEGFIVESGICVVNERVNEFCRPEQTNAASAGTSVAEPTVNEQTRRKLRKVRLCSSGGTLRDLVPAYVNNPRL